MGLEMATEVPWYHCVCGIVVVGIAIILSGVIEGLWCVVRWVSCVMRCALRFGYLKSNFSEAVQKVLTVYERPALHSSRNHTDALTISILDTFSFFSCTLDTFSLIIADNGNAPAEIGKTTTCHMQSQKDTFSETQTMKESSKLVSWDWEFVQWF